ncbi:transporter substrate-binding domain-containing protein [Leptolyngbya sp. FACHB-711]|uniref:transporter substrate-binding domain-containing protein n=2 Tax=unclassified Leptolyngbya TaxID=2650499 RepID=UPI0018F02093
MKLLRKRFDRLNRFLSMSLLLGGWAIGFVCGFVEPGAAATLAEIRQRGYLVVAVKDNLRPLGFISNGGQVQGFEIDLARWLAQALLGDANAVQFLPVANRDRISSLLEDQADLVIARLSVTDARARLVDFSLPYFIDGTGFVTRSEAVQSLRDLSGQQIAVLNGSDTISTVRSLIPNVQLRGINSYQEAKAVLQTDEVAAFAADATVLAGWVQEFPDDRLLPNLISADALAVGMPRGQQFAALRQQVNTAIEQWQESGTLQQRVLFWGLPEDGIPEVRQTSEF